MISLIVVAGCATSPKAIRPPAPEAAVIVPQPRQVVLVWSNWPAGTSNVLRSGQAATTLTNALDVGATNLAVVSEPVTRTFYQVHPTVGGRAGVPSNVIKLPPDILREFWATLPDSRKIVLGRTTNTPPGQSGFYRVNYSEWQDYSP